jgi:leucyl aminopeptidase
VVYQAAGSAARELSKKKRTRVAFALDAAWPDELVASAVAGASVGCHGQDLYRSEKKQNSFDEVHWIDASAEGVERGAILGRAVNVTRRLVNGSPQDVYPESFANAAEEVAGEFGLQAEIWAEDELEKEKCGALLAVARGSSRPPRLVILRHQGAATDASTLALVGKGVTFDSGGLSLKPSDGMLTMKCDMAGAATVLGAMQAIAELKLPVNVIGLMGLVENMPSRDAYKLGDVLTSRTGKTIEVHNTDAEGRLVLADTLSVAVDRGADRIVDLATLTGACCVALGLDVAGLMTNDQEWCDQVIKAAADCGEQAWQLPMFAEFGEQIRGDVADINNVGEGRWGGAMTAAKLLEEFVDNKPWVHIDIAGPAFVEKPKPWIAGGGSGAFVRTLVALATLIVRDTGTRVVND